ncbi:hypothetical protein KAFR_0J01630 [Kazachstania africana CBS 2517]|uniref:Uncharacterized protein n=1 Tax=Kazachstania africana (strain ATCC 22294 / BCRC 22015 / CBS 2517 / CECT 1963 / NBRC 1671 / NRRL Y-8276) TaxID=1071382 RepID=H2B0S8_KAZAF|nr:hypothetical protein KAFR_0J01630 [Kazachstania africana CBS 2517]CCF60228.1 hypothetical protein KAFR_0J01630 [Kazachstania africana CBS 2517]
MVKRSHSEDANASSVKHNDDEQTLEESAVTTRPTTSSSISSINSLLNKKAKDDTNTAKKSLRIEVLKELGIKDIEKLEPIDQDVFHKYVSIRLTRERRSLEELRQGNIEKLDSLIDKCINSEKFSSASMNKLLDIIGTSRDQPDSSNDKFSVSPVPKKRKLESPHLSSPRHLMSYKENIPTLNESEELQNESRQFKLPAPHNQASNQAYLGYATVPPPNAYQSHGSGTPQHVRYDNNEPRQLSPNVTPAQYSNMTQYGAQYPQPFYGQDMRQPVLVMQRPPAGETPYLNPPQTTLAPTSPYGNEQYFPPSRKPIANHRRSQSAIVSLPSDMRQQQNRNQQNFPSRPVNFLIHTPKHPPPA